MANKTELKGKWDQARGRIKEAWGTLTDDDVDRAEGKWDRFVGIVREKTGQTVEAIESKLNSIFDSVEDSVEDATDDTDSVKTK